MYKHIFILFSSFCFSFQSTAKIKIVTTTTDIRALVEAVGGDFVQVTAIAKGTMDPHFIEAKPSYMIKLRDAQLLIYNGLSLEIGWLNSLVQGARNPKVNPGSTGNLELGRLIDILEKPTGSISRAMGDVHPEGNPHFTLDPIRIGELALKIAERLSILDAENKKIYLERAQSYQQRLVEKTKDWQVRLDKTGIKKIITHHRSLNYFLNRFGLESAIQIESKPGVPPSAQHILNVIQLVKKERVRIALIDSFFDTRIANRVAQENPQLKVKSVAISVDALPELKTIEDVQEQLVRAIEGI